MPAPHRLTGGSVGARDFLAMTAASEGQGGKP
jgi:hypothetical protein